MGVASFPLPILCPSLPFYSFCGQGKYTELEGFLAGRRYWRSYSVRWGAGRMWAGKEMEELNLTTKAGKFGMGEIF